ncbi:hypothetical protein B0H12DRAFT_1113265 [Mycena haematopus]|nr:hypothetical protein B0H12DRAFT_1113265 [Mycena haematopus]
MGSMSMSWAVMSVYVWCPPSPALVPPNNPADIDYTLSSGLLLSVGTVKDTTKAVGL